MVFNGSLQNHPPKPSMASVAPIPFIARVCAFGPDKAACSGHPPSTARRPAGRAAASSAASFFTAACLLPALRHKHRPRCQRYASSGTSGPRVAVVGAGPAGLATALALRKEAGLQDVTVLERAPELRQVQQFVPECSKVPKAKGPDAKIWCRRSAMFPLQALRGLVWAVVCSCTQAHPYWQLGKANANV